MLAVSAGGFIFAPFIGHCSLAAISGKNSPTHAASNSRSRFPYLCTEKLSRLQQVRVTISPLPHTTSPFKSPYHDKAETDIS